MGSKPVEDQTPSRRSFLKMAGAGAPAALVAVAASADRAEASTDKVKSGVQDTAHTRAYYDSARF